MPIKLNATRFRLTENRLTLFIPSGFLSALKDLIARNKNPEYLGAEIYLPRKKRTVGENSQNHLIHLYLDALVEYTGYSKEEVKYWIKTKAERRGLKMRELPDGIRVPKSEADMDTLEASFYIDELAQACAENGLNPFDGVY